MADNYLITGYWGEPHVTAENERGINAAVFGEGQCVLPVGNQFCAEYVGNNTVTLKDGMLMFGGAAGGIPVGNTVNVVIPEAAQGMNRNDIIVFQYEKDALTLKEKGTFVVVSGRETAGEPEDPELQGGYFTRNTLLYQMGLWRVRVSGAVISDPVQMFRVAYGLADVAFMAQSANALVLQMAPTFSTEDLVAGESELETGKMYFVYE